MRGSHLKRHLDSASGSCKVNGGTVAPGLGRALPVAPHGPGRRLGERARARNARFRMLGGLGDSDPPVKAPGAYTQVLQPASASTITDLSGRL